MEELTRHYVDEMQNITHPKLMEMSVVRQDTLQLVIPPQQEIDAVIVDVTTWEAIAKANNPLIAPNQSRALYFWLGISTFPAAVFDYFASRGNGAEGAKFFAYQPGRFVIHVVQPEVQDVTKALGQLGKIYENIFQEYFQAMEEGTIRQNCPMRLPALASATNAILVPHLPAFSLSALALVLARLPLEEVFPASGAIELCIPSEDWLAFHKVLSEKKALLAPLKVNRKMCAVPKKKGQYHWIARDNDTHDNMKRLNAMFDTLIATWHQGYVVKGAGVELRGIERLIAGTKIITEDVARDFLRSEKSPGYTTKYTRIEDAAETGATLMDVAINRQEQGMRVVVVAPVSAYSWGGGSMSGTRHAAEESWCVMSTLIRSLSRASYLSKVQRERGELKAQPGPYRTAYMPYIPEAACVISPSVEIFREQFRGGYAFTRKAVELAGIISMPAFNKNPKVAFTPLDAPPDGKPYNDALTAKWRSTIGAAAWLRPDLVIIPDVGCGMFKNDPRETGLCLNTILQEAKGFLPEVMLIGDPAFIAAAMEKLGKSEKVDTEFAAQDYAQYTEAAAPAAQVRRAMLDALTARIEKLTAMHDDGNDGHPLTIEELEDSEAAVNKVEMEVISAIQASGVSQTVEARTTKAKLNALKAEVDNIIRMRTELKKVATPSVTPKKRPSKPWGDTLNSLPESPKNQSQPELLRETGFSRLTKAERRLRAESRRLEKKRVEEKQKRGNSIKIRHNREQRERIRHLMEQRGLVERKRAEDERQARKAQLEEQRAVLAEKRQVAATSAAMKRSAARADANSMEHVPAEEQEGLKDAQKRDHEVDLPSRVSFSKLRTSGEPSRPSQKRRDEGMRRSMSAAQGRPFWDMGPIPWWERGGIGEEEAVLFRSSFNEQKMARKRAELKDLANRVAAGEDVPEATSNWWITAGKKKKRKRHQKAKVNRQLQWTSGVFSQNNIEDGDTPLNVWRGQESPNQPRLFSKEKYNQKAMSSFLATMRNAPGSPRQTCHRKRRSRSSLAETNTDTNAASCSLLPRGAAQAHGLVDIYARLNVTTGNQGKIADIVHPAGTPLHVAIERGVYDMFDKLLKNVDAAGLDRPDYFGWTPLHAAVHFKRVEEVRRLLHAGADVNVTDAMAGWTPLHLAVYHGNADIVQLLLNEADDIDVHVTDKDGNSALHNSITWGTPEVAHHLLCALCPSLCIRTSERAKLTGGDLRTVENVERMLADILNSPNRVGRTSLQLASRRGHIDLVTMILSIPGVDVNGQFNNGWAPLHYASFHGHDQVVATLLANPLIDANIKDAEGQTPLHHACAAGRSRCAFFLLTHSDASTNDVNTFGQTPLHYACYYGHGACVDVLLDINLQRLREETGETVGWTQADVRIRDANGTVLAAAAMNGHAEVVHQLLTTTNVDENAEGSDGRTALMHAVTQGHLEVVELLLRTPGLLINKRDNEGQGALHYAAANRRPRIIGALMSNRDIDVNAQNKVGQSPFHYACHMGYTEIIAALFYYAPQINVTTLCDGDSCLNTACRQGLTDVCALILGRTGIDVNARGSDGWAPLHHAVFGNYQKIASMLLDHPACDVNVVTFDGTTALMFAATKGQDKMVDLLINWDELDMNVFNADGQAALHYAAYYDNVGAVQAMLRLASCTVNIADHKKWWSPLHHAVSQGNHDTTDVLLKSVRTNVNTQDKDGCTALHCACYYGQYGTFGQLLGHRGIDLSVENSAGNVPLHVAVGQGHFEMARTLLLQRANVNCRNKYGQTPLHVACHSGTVEVVEMLLSHRDIDANIKTNDGITPMHYTVMHAGRLDLLDMMLQAENYLLDDWYRGTANRSSTMVRVPAVDRNARSHDGRTPLHFACHYGNLDIVARLLDARTDVEINMRSNDGRTVLHTACEAGQPEVCALLLEKGEAIQLDMNASDKTGMSALHLACAHGHLRTVQVLLRSPLIHCDIVDNHGSTPLCHAARNGFSHVVQCLIDTRHADVNVRGNDGWAALHFAAARGHVGVMSALLDARDIDLNIASSDGMTPLLVAVVHDKPDAVQWLLDEKEVKVNAVNSAGQSPLHYAISLGHAEIFKQLLQVPNIKVDVQNKLPWTKHIVEPGKRMLMDVQGDNPHNVQMISNAVTAQPQALNVFHG